MVSKCSFTELWGTAVQLGSQSVYYKPEATASIILSTNKENNRKSVTVTAYGIKIMLMPFEWH